MWPGNENLIRNIEHRFGDKIHNITYRYGIATRDDFDMDTV